jgi:hypothetical protein
VNLERKVHILSFQTENLFLNLNHQLVLTMTNGSKIVQHYSIAKKKRNSFKRSKEEKKKKKKKKNRSLSNSKNAIRQYFFSQIGMHLKNESSSKPV